MSEYDFEEFKKIPRLNRDIIITEKIDGTNGQVLIVPAGVMPVDRPRADLLLAAVRIGEQLSHQAPLFEDIVDATHLVYAGSRNRWVSPGKDNFGFAGWVQANAVALCTVLGYGRHYGEWWGPGINRGYGLAEKRFSLFNASKWGWLADPGARAARPEIPLQLGVVPTLYTGPWFTDVTYSDWAPFDAMNALRANGSVASPGFMRPEGIVVFHVASGTLFKATLENDEKPKGAK